MRSYIIFCFLLTLLPIQFLTAQPVGNKIAGKVLDAGSEPMEGVIVVIFSSANTAYIRNGTKELNHSGNSGMKTESDAEGKWQLDDPKLPYGLYFYHKNGYVFFNSGLYVNDSNVQLKPWSRVNGNLSVFSGYHHHETISLSMVNRMGGMNSVFFHYETKTNRSGEFVFENVIESEFQVSHMVPQNLEQTNGSTHVVSNKTVTMIPGEEVYVSLWSFNSAHPYYINPTPIIFIAGTTVALLLFYLMRRYAHRSLD